MPLSYLFRIYHITPAPKPNEKQTITKKKKGKLREGGDLYEGDKLYSLARVL